MVDRYIVIFVIQRIIDEAHENGSIKTTTLLNRQMSVLRMHVSNLIDIDYMVAPDLHVGVTSTEALNGYKSYGVVTRALGSSGDVRQVQYCPDGSEFHRVRTGAAWSEWFAGVMPYDYTGKMVFDYDLGKPLWVIHANQQRLTVSTPLVIGAFSITCGPATLANANCSFVIGSQSATFAVESTDTGADIAATLAEISPDGYTGTVEGSTVTFTRVSGGLSIATQISIVDDGSGATYDIGPGYNEPQTLPGDITVQLAEESDAVTLTVTKGQDAYSIGEELALLFADNTEWDAEFSHAPVDSVLFTAKTIGVQPFMDVDAGTTQVLLSIAEEAGIFFVDATGQRVNK